MGKDKKSAKQQIVVIHGGNTFDTYRKYIDFLKSYKIDIDRLGEKRWKENLAEGLGKSFDVILLKMPNPTNAKYKEWKIMLERLFPFLTDNPILLGHSLGGIFLAKYLSENKFPKNILATFIVAAPYRMGNFILPKNLSKLRKQGGKIFIYHSKDDPIIPFSDFEKYKRDLPEAKAMVFRNRGHFGQTEFPEIIKGKTFRELMEEKDGIPEKAIKQYVDIKDSIIPRFKKDVRLKEYKNAMEEFECEISCLGNVMVDKNGDIKIIDW